MGNDFSGVLKFDSEPTPQMQTGADSESITTAPATQAFPADSPPEQMPEEEGEKAEHAATSGCSVGTWIVLLAAVVLCGLLLLTVILLEAAGSSSAVASTGQVVWLSDLHLDK